MTWLPMSQGRAFDIGFLPELALYSVPDQWVELEAETGVIAKEKAVEEAVRRGLRLVLDRILPRRDAHRIAEAAKIDPRDLVVSLAINKESARPTHYQAEISVQFSRDRVLRLVRRHGARYSESQSPPMVIIPVVTRDGEVDWEEKAWRKAWTRHSDRNGIVPMTVFNASVEDRSYLDGDPLKLSQTVLGLMALRYLSEYSTVIVIQAGAFDQDADVPLKGSLKPDVETDSAKSGVLVRMNGFDAHGPFSFEQTFEGLRGAAGTEMDAAISATIAELEDRWKAAALGRRHQSLVFDRPEENQTRDGVEARLSARERHAVEEVLQSVPGIVDYSFSGDGLNDIAHIQFDGDFELLQSALVQRGIFLSNTEEGLRLTTY